MSDFSIQRLLSPQLGHKPATVGFSPDGYLQGIPGGFCLDYRNLRPPVPVVPVVPVPVPVCCAEGFYGSYGSGFHHSDFSSFQNSGVYLMHLSQLDSTDAQQIAGYHGYHQTESAAHQQPRHKTRMRTVFTDAQTKQLEALFELTDYPAAEARAVVAGNTGLSEEIVRVWFKNRRARRKRQRSGSNI